MLGGGEEEVGRGGRTPRERAAAETRPRSVRCRLTGVRSPSPVKERHLPPGVEMGRNGPEHRPGSETPRPPSSGAGGVPEGNQSPSRRPSPSTFLSGAPSPQP